MMNNLRGSFSRSPVPMASKGRESVNRPTTHNGLGIPDSTEEDLDDVESTVYEKPFILPLHPDNSYQLKPLTEPDAEELPYTPNVPEVSSVNSNTSEGVPEVSGTDEVDGVSGIDDGLLPEKPLSYPKPGLDPSTMENTLPPHQKFLMDPDLPDLNVYQHKKTVAQGMMDIALLSANANQLRYVLESGGNHPYYYASLILIGISLLLQVVVGVGLILNSRYNVSYETSMRKANRINNYTVLAIFLITVMNVFISAFGIASVSNVNSFPPSPRLQIDGSEIELQE